MIKAILTTTAICGFVILGSAIHPGASHAGALDELRATASGDQHTGTTFDGSPSDQHRGTIDTSVGAN